MTRLTANEMLKIIEYQWATSKDIQKIGSVGVNTSQKIRKHIADELIAEGYRLPKNLVPMKKVIDYFKIDISYLKKVSKEGNHEKEEIKAK